LLPWLSGARHRAMLQKSICSLLTQGSLAH
jgi:hypothetical protein